MPVPFLWTHPENSCLREPSVCQGHGQSHASGRGQTPRLACSTGKGALRVGFQVSWV